METDLYDELLNDLSEAKDEKALLRVIAYALLDLAETQTAMLGELREGIKTRANT